MQNKKEDLYAKTSITRILFKFHCFQKHTYILILDLSIGFIIIYTWVTSKYKVFKYKVTRGYSVNANYLAAKIPRPKLKLFWV